MRFSTATARTMVLILSLSKDEDHTPGLDIAAPYRALASGVKA